MVTETCEKRVRKALRERDSMVLVVCCTDTPLILVNGRTEWNVFHIILFSSVQFSNVLNPHTLTSQQWHISSDLHQNSYSRMIDNIVCMNVCTNT